MKKKVHQSEKFTLEYGEIEYNRQRPLSLFQMIKTAH